MCKVKVNNIAISKINRQDHLTKGFPETPISEVIDNRLHNTMECE